MFANLDYPEADEPFLATVAAEARAAAGRIGGRPCLAVLCGGSEVAQQVAMLGLDPRAGPRSALRRAAPRAGRRGRRRPRPTCPSTPWGGELPFRTDRGVAHYYGVGAYLRPLEDARRAEVRFAAECLAFANVPDEAGLQALAGGGAAPGHHPAWKAGVPRDGGAGWDFEDVRDHYLKLLFGLDPVELRSVDPERYLELSRAVSGEVMAEVIGEWRRTGSTCHGALILWLKDLAPGAGWGVLDHRGLPKVAYHHLRRVLAPVAVWITDEGLGGIDVHVANDRAAPLAARLRISLYRDDRLVDEAFTPVQPRPRRGADPQRRDRAGALRGRVVGLPVRASGPGPDRGQPGAGRRGGHAALPGVSLPRGTAAAAARGRGARDLRPSPSPTSAGRACASAPSACSTAPAWRCPATWPPMTRSTSSPAGGGASPSCPPAPERARQRPRRGGRGAHGAEPARPGQDRAGVGAVTGVIATLSRPQTAR